MEISSGPFEIDQLLRLIRNERCPKGTVFFIGDSRQPTSIAELQKRIEACAKAYRVPPPSAHMEAHEIDGRSVLVIGSKNNKNVRRSD